MNTQLAQNTPQGEYRIYVASLSDYNAGRLHGVWIDCDGMNADDLTQTVNEMLAQSKHPNVIRKQCDVCSTIYEGNNQCPNCTSWTFKHINSAEEFAIHDTEGLNDLIGEYTSLSDVAEIVDALESAENPAALIEYAGYCGGDFEYAKEHFEDAYCGEWGTFEKYVEETFDEIYEIPDHLANYIDYAAVARDWEADHYFSNGYVFRTI